MNDDLVGQNRILAIAMIIIAIVNIVRRFRHDTLLSAVGGLHVGLLIFYGIGPLANTFVKLNFDYFVAPDINVYNNIVLQYVFWCYLAFTVITIALKRKQASSFSQFKSVTTQELNILNFKTLVISFLGYLFAEQEFAQSGIGTIFPVCKNLLFPTIVLLIYNYRSNNLPSILLIIAGFVFVGISAFLSAWRSELIMFLFSIGLGLSLRKKIFLLYGFLFGPLIIMLIIPFQALKKSRKIKEDQNIVSAFVSSLSGEDYERGSMTTTLLAFRLNYVRESAYVLRGIEREYITYRYGQTYSETVLQLIPRAVWPDKPSFNYLANRVIPRQIGLLNKLDKYTSWGVNYYAEFLYNFPIYLLPIFFLIYFGLLRWLDMLSDKIGLSMDTLLLLKTTLFFQALSTVTLSAASTYFLWIFIIIKLIDKLRVSSKTSGTARYARQ